MRQDEDSFDSYICASAIQYSSIEFASVRDNVVKGIYVS